YCPPPSARSTPSAPNSAAPAAMAATPPATAAAPPAVSAPAPAATAALRLRTCFVDHQISPAEILAVQGINRAVCIFVAINLNEGEAARLARKTVTNEIDT